MLPPDSYHLIALSLVFYTDDYFITIKLMADLTTHLTIKAAVAGLDELQNLIKKLEEAGVDTTELAGSANKLQSSFNKLSTKQQASDLDKLNTSTKKADSGFGGLKTQADKTHNSFNQLNKVASGLKGAFAALGISAGVSELIQLGDEFANLQSRLKLATGDGLAFKSALTGITDIANKTGSDLTATADLFGKLSRATSDLGLSQSELLGVTDSISKAMQVSGGSAESMNAALTQLAQGLSAGALRGDELNSVMEQSPRLAQALADGLGVGIGKLRQMGAEGELTAEKVITAMQSQADVINQEFAQMPVTVGASIQVLKNSLLSFVGNLSDELNSNGALADFIQSIADKLNNLDPKTVEAVKLTFENLGQIVENVFGQAKTLYNTLSALGSSGSEQVGLLTQAIQYLNVALGLLADAGAGVKIGFDVVFGGLLITIGHIKDAFGGLIALINTDLGEQIKQSGQTIINQGKALLNEAHDGAMAFQSKTTQALQAFGKTNADILTEQADTAKAAYETMAQSGKASSDELQSAFADYAQKAIEASGGVIDDTLKLELAQHKLQAVINDTGKVTVQAMDTAKTATAELANELERYKDKESYFKALGLDINEFATGVNEKAKSALIAFSEVARLAKGDVEKLARAYNAAKKQIGDNAIATDNLNQKLTQMTGGNEQLAEAVKRYAKEQQNAKGSSDAQAAALKALGVEMAAVNQGMSQSASEMSAHLQTGLMAIKEQALGANELKTALTTAFNTATAAAQTVNDFKAIDTAIKTAGLSASLTAEQIKVLQTGIQGGADAVKKAMAEQAQAAQSAKKASDELTKTSDNNTVASKDNTTASKDNAAAKAELARATDTATTASANYNAEQSKTQDLIPAGIAQMQRKIATLSQFGASQEQITQTTQTMHNALNTMTFGTMGDLVFAINNINKGLDRQIESFKHQSLAVDTATKALQGASVSANDLANAQGVLNIATQASINGIIRLDQSRLDNLKAQIDGAKARMDSLAKSAKTTADSLEGELARLKGDDVRAAQIENSKKLSDLEDKLADAKRRHNRTEIAELERALNLQQQINTARLQTVSDKQNSQQNNKPSTGNRRNSSNSSNSSFNSNSSTSSGSSINAKQVADAWEERIKQAEQAAVNRFATQLHSEAKRRAK